MPYEKTPERLDVGRKVSPPPPAVFAGTDTMRWRRQPAVVSLDLEHLAHGLSDSRHEVGAEAGERALDDASIVDGPKLVHEQIRGAIQAAGWRDPEAERLGVVEDGGGEWDHEGGGMPGTQQGPGLER